MRFLLLPLLASTVCFSLPASAELRVAHVFQDHMVLQQKMPLPVWGWAGPGAAVRVAFAGQEQTAKADGTGYWKATLTALPASSEGRKLTVTAGSATVTLNDILVGEVWLCAGQSNMARMLLSESRDYPQYQTFMKEAEFPAIRFIRYQTDVSETPLTDFDPVVQHDIHWQVLSNATSKDTMSIPFFFAKEINKALGVPVVLVEVAVAGTPQTAWLARETLEEVAKKIPGEPDFQKRWAESEGRLAGLKEDYHDWAGFKAAEAAWKANPSGRWPGANQLIPDFPSGLYNALVCPLAPLAFQGVLWHQGESGPASNHRERMVAQMTQWRKLFGRDFHFLWGSLARNTSTPPPLGASAASLRANINEEFLLAAQDWESGGDSSVLLNFADLGNNATHWGRKDEAGRRMAGAALATVYGKPNTVFTGPELVEAKIEGAVIRAKFRYVGGGLVYEPSVDGISGFLIEEKGATPALRWAEVAIKGDTVILSHPDVHKPTNAYYGWHLNPHETLFNKEGYPAYSFRAVPRTNASKGDEAPPLVELVGAPPKVLLDVKHVRRNGYLFSVQQKGGSGKTMVRVRLPKEWKDANVSAGGKPVNAGPEKTGDGGLRSREFEVEINGPPITVGNAAQPPDFSRVDRF